MSCSVVYRPLRRLIVSMCLVLAFSGVSWGATEITYRVDQTGIPAEDMYDYQLLKLALEKTREQYGDYKLVPIGEEINLIRSVEYAEQNRYPNLVFKQSVSLDITKRLGYVPFPVDLGIVGYRVGFVSSETEPRISQVNSLAELKKFSVIQGLGWTDIDILRQSGFSVVTGSNFTGLYYMAANNRGDIFMRGTNELLDEWEKNKKVEDLRYEKSIALYYPLPRFFFTNSANKALIAQLSEGLDIAYQDGSLLELWKRYYIDSIQFVNLKQRKIFRMENPLLRGIDKEYEKYIVDPTKL